LVEGGDDVSVHLKPNNVEGPGSQTPATETRDEGRVLLFRGTGLVGWLIKWQTRSPYSHAALLYPDGRTVIEAREFRGVREHVLTEKEWEQVDVFEVPEMDEDQWRAVWVKARGLLGLPYDYWAVLKFVSRRPARQNGRWFCSELVCNVLASVGCRLLERMPCHETHPGHLRLSPKLRGPLTWEELNR
jgi:hypothetical protein